MAKIPQPTRGWWNPRERRGWPVLPVGARRPADKVRAGGAPTGRNPHDRVLLHTPPGMKRRRRGTPKVQGGDGRTGTPTSGRHSPPKAGGGKDPQFRGGPFSAGIPAFRVIRTLEWQTPFAALRAPCLRPVKADGNEPPAALRAALPTGGRPSSPGGGSLTHAPSRLSASRGLHFHSNRPGCIPTETQR